MPAPVATTVTPAIVYTTALCSEAHFVIRSQNDDDAPADALSRDVGSVEDEPTSICSADMIAGGLRKEVGWAGQYDEQPLKWSGDIE